MNNNLIWFFLCYNEVTLWDNNLSGLEGVDMDSVWTDFSTVSKLVLAVRCKACESFSVSRLLHSILAISVATQEGMSGMAKAIQYLSINMTCWKNQKTSQTIWWKHACSTLTSNMMIKSMVWVLVIFGNILCTCPERPIKAQLTRTPTMPINSMAFCHDPMLERQTKHIRHRVFEKFFLIDLKKCYFLVDKYNTC